MKRKLAFISFNVLMVAFCFGQNVGIGNPAPAEKLHIDSGSIKIGKLVWNASNPPLFLKFGDGNFITLGEEEEDDKLTLRAKELLIRPSGSYNTVPVTLQGSNIYSHFFFGTNEDTYIRGGKPSSNVVIGSELGGRVGVSVYPTRAGFEQNGAVGATTAIFGGEGSGISLQRNWPAIGFNSYLDGSGHKSITQGYGAQLGLNQLNGSLYLVSFPFTAGANQAFPSFTQRFYVSRFGRIGLGTDDPQSDIHIIQRNFTDVNENTDMGLTLEGTGNYETFPNTFFNSKWNLHVGYGVNSGQFTGLDFLAFWRNTNNSGWFRASAIGTDGSYYQYSDRNRKTDISYLDKSSIEKIMELRPAKYHLREAPQKSEFSYGFIAQDVEKIFPEFVASFSDTKMLNYTAFIPVLTKGIQEQQQQIETLQNENADLKARLERLEKMVLKNQ